MATQGFRREARVVETTPEGVVKLSLKCATMCDGCHAKGACPSSAGVDRVVSVVSDMSSELAIGESVEVGVSYSIGAMVVVYAYLLPLVLFVLAIVLSLLLGAEQWLAALLGFGVAMLYYVGLYLLRGRMERVVRFDIRRF